MNRIDFLHSLYLALDGVPEPARREMLSDYEEHFRQAALAGRGEEETAASLGDPVCIAGELMASRAASDGASTNNHPVGAGNAPPPGWSPAPGSMPTPGWRPPSSRRGCLPGCLFGSVMLLLNLVFILGPVLALFGVLLGAWCTALGLSIGGLTALVASLAAFSAPGWVPASLSFATVLAGSVMLISGGMLLGMGLWHLTGWMFRMTLAYAKWTISLITTRRF